MAALSLPERMALIDDLWDSVDESLEALAPPEWHRQMLDEILDEDERSPQLTVDWVELRAELARGGPVSCSVQAEASRSYP